jgi:hypothetical protein
MPGAPDGPPRSARPWRLTARLALQLMIYHLSEHRKCLQRNATAQGLPSTYAERRGVTGCLAVGAIGQADRRGRI